MAFFKGEPIILKGIFKNDAGTKVDPQQPVKVRIKDPQNTIEVSGSDSTRESPGTYTFQHTFLKDGLYTYRFKSADNSIEVKTIEIKEDDTE